jgi:hypothetical protein
MAKTPVYLDLDAVAPEKEIVVKLGGKEHTLVPVSVDDFVKNVAAMEDLAGSEGDLLKTMNILKNVVQRAFPTLDMETISKLTLPQLNSSPASSIRTTALKR